MTPEPEQNTPEASGRAGSNKAGSDTAGGKARTKPRAGVPVWRTGKPDAVLAAAVDDARTAVEGIAEPWQIGRHLGAKTEGDRLVTHLFESKLPGYLGWQWYAVLTRNSRSKVVTVDELGLLPSEESILAPVWVPWAERVRPEDEQGDEAAEAESVAEPVEQAAAESDDDVDDDYEDSDDEDSGERNASALEAD
ncbi:DUF3027 domain-containing protein [Arthrobacter sp. PAMC25564]|uniref:DUF3027 domain-containing protein n=1 Tax=Arthrobacter sp. PAMC25564 TaxID=2565366 RepID=UPI0010A28B85|nr:DUF3027 domain-containing protein [Arthrobacter sp. PAMC25564]QCB98707.1 DUF3027 domain-containing protein [Arthrobacter sp. PAMC25564]